MANVGGPNRPQLHLANRQGFIDAANEAPQGGHVKVVGGQVRAGTLVGMEGQAWNWLVAMPGPVGAQTRDRNRQAIEAFVGALVQAGYARAAVEGELGRHLPSLDGRHRLSREALLDTTRALQRLAPNAAGGPPAAPGASGIAPAAGAAQQIAAPVPEAARDSSSESEGSVYGSSGAAEDEDSVSFDVSELSGSEPGSVSFGLSEDSGSEAGSDHSVATDDTGYIDAASDAGRSDDTGYIVYPEHPGGRTRGRAAGPIPTIVGGGYTPPDEDDPDFDGPGSDRTRA